MLDDVIEHEMAHLLGFGTVWDLDGFLRDTTTSDPWFSGPDAQAAFRKALPSFRDKIVPVEANGGSGTTLSHWRESVMTNELMTGFLNNGANPLSAVTIESMADLGYTVNVGAADPWPTPSSGVSGAAAQPPPVPSPLPDRPPTRCYADPASGSAARARSVRSPRANQTRWRAPPPTIYLR